MQQMLFHNFHQRALIPWRLQLWTAGNEVLPLAGITLQTKVFDSVSILGYIRDLDTTGTIGHSTGHGLLVEGFHKHGGSFRRVLHITIPLSLVHSVTEVPFNPLAASRSSSHVTFP